MKNNWAKKKDLNHNEIAAAMREAGWQWTDTYTYGRGFPDGIAASACLPAPITILVEIKSPGGTLSEAEKKFHAGFVGNLIIANSGPCAVEQAGSIRALHLGGRNAA